MIRDFNFNLIQFFNLTEQAGSKYKHIFHPAIRHSIDNVCMACCMYQCMHFYCYSVFLNFFSLKHFEWIFDCGIQRSINQLYYYLTQKLAQLHVSNGLVQLAASDKVKQMKVIWGIFNLLKVTLTNGNILHHHKWSRLTNWLNQDESIHNQIDHLAAEMLSIKYEQGKYRGIWRSRYQ